MFRQHQEIIWIRRLIRPKSITKSIYHEPIKTLPRKKYLVEKSVELLLRNMNSHEIMNQFRRLYITTNVAKYRSFQYCLLHNALFTNVNLFRWTTRTVPFVKEQKRT